LEPQIYVHEDFDHRTVLPPFLWPYEEDAKYLQHLVYQHGLLRHGAAARKDRAVNLKHAYLAEIIEGRQVRHIRDCLEQRGWLKCDHQYAEGQKSFTYWLGPKAARGKFRLEPLSKPNFIEKIQNWQRRKEVALTPTMQHIVSLLPQISLDEEHAAVLLRQGSLGSRQALQEQFMFIRNGVWYWTRCDAGRLYTNITSLRTDGRGALRVNRSRLCNIDISNSQFLALILLVENWFYSRPLDYIKEQETFKANTDPLLAVDPFTIVPYFPETPPVLTRTQKGKGGEGERRGRLTICTECADFPKKTAKSAFETMVSLQDPEFLLFRELTESGELKAYVAKRLRKSVKVTKQVLWQWLFGQSKREAKAARRIEEVFPKLFQFVRTIKQGKGGNKWFSHLLTKIESKLVLDGAAARIASERPEMFFTTIHDSVMVEPGNVDYVQGVLREVYAQQGLGVHLKVEQEFKRK
jgi:hypothetical protein